MCLVESGEHKIFNMSFMEERISRSSVLQAFAFVSARVRSASPPVYSLLPRSVLGYSIQSSSVSCRRTALGRIVLEKALRHLLVEETRRSSVVFTFGFHVGNFSTPC
eukprot:TRINITY_DN14161_c1_g2_i1.p1 TRINITY_DN14161_c1_g2~~TRINITY_DN14161_c1_g2_i1.p1  ORF type:complete len:107 (+),score=0.93 TRINITY_DN14161_c1_g2_i1:108-428(+)